MRTGDEKRELGAVLLVGREASAGKRDDGADRSASPQDAPPVDGPARAPGARVSGPRHIGVWIRIFWALGALVLSAMAAFALERLVVEAAEIAPWVGWAMRGLVLALLIVFAILVFREIAALGRVRRIGRIRRLAMFARETGDLKDADAALRAMAALYVGRRDIGAPISEATRRAQDAFEVEDRLAAFERAIFAPLDEEARRIVRGAARDVATITALAPSVLLDAVAALYVNLRTIRRLAQLYGGRAGFLGSLRLARRVVEHAMAAGLIALGDDILEPLMGGGIASKLSRRLGEGVVNGAMTARIGIAAMEVCRPLPFEALPKPKLREIAWSALRSVVAERTAGGGPPAGRDRG
ncbi:MAG: TIGR01620 family protein [Neomegalonema sp.]|nr:TIGR01620 family protein [Neomegalonema sp.]